MKVTVSDVRIISHRGSSAVVCDVGHIKGHLLHVGNRETLEYITKLPAYVIEATFEGGHGSKAARLAAIAAQHGVHPYTAFLGNLGAKR